MGWDGATVLVLDPAMTLPALCQQHGDTLQDVERFKAAYDDGLAVALAQEAERR